MIKVYRSTLTFRNNPYKYQRVDTRPGLKGIAYKHYDDFHVTVEETEIGDWAWELVRDEYGLKYGEKEEQGE